jgi:hypothetical protein
MLYVYAEECELNDGYWNVQNILGIYTDLNKLVERINKVRQERFKELLKKNEILEYDYIHEYLKENSKQRFAVEISYITEIEENEEFEGGYDTFIGGHKNSINVDEYFENKLWNPPKNDIINHNKELEREKKNKEIENEKIKEMKEKALYFKLKEKYG